MNYETLKSPYISIPKGEFLFFPQKFQTKSSELHFNSISKWIKFLKATPILSYAIGVSPSDVPGVGSHYDFINRLWLENPEIEQKRQDDHHPFF